MKENDQEVWITHGFALKDDLGDDGVKREFHVNLLSNGRYGVCIKTLWPEDAPVETRLIMSGRGMSLLAQALTIGLHEMHKWPAIKQEKQNAAQLREKLNEAG